MVPFEVTGDTVGPLELLQHMGLLHPVHVAGWRKGNEYYRVLEPWIQVGPEKFQKALRYFAEWVKACGLRISGLAADFWGAKGPGTDAALALGMMHVIVRDSLHDADYVERYTLGFDRLKPRLTEYPPERVAGITGIPASEIEELGRAYATTRPAAIISSITGTRLWWVLIVSARFVPPVSMVSG